MKECGICFEYKGHMKKLSCMHEICSNCLIGVINSNLIFSCPFCRIPIKKIESIETLIYPYTKNKFSILEKLFKNGIDIKPCLHRFIEYADVIIIRFMIIHLKIPITKDIVSCAICSHLQRYILLSKGTYDPLDERELKDSNSIMNFIIKKRIS